MKQKNIKQDTKRVVISSLLNLCIQIAIIYLWITKFSNLVGNTLLHSLIWVIIMALAIQTLFLPYLTWIRIKEIREGEIYEASKY